MNEKPYRYKNKTYVKQKNNWYVEYTPKTIYWEYCSLEELIAQLLEVSALIPDVQMYSEYEDSAINFRSDWIKVIDPQTIETLNSREEVWKAKDKAAKKKADALQREREEKELTRLAKKLGKKILE